MAGVATCSNSNIALRFSPARFADLACLGILSGFGIDMIALEQYSIVSVANSYLNISLP
jgi:hypothetical protein